MGTPKVRRPNAKERQAVCVDWKVALDEGTLDAPRAWRKPRLIFVNSMSDLFQDAVPLDFIRRVWLTMAATPHHTCQILTKRPARMAALSADLPVLPNVWLGTSVENGEVLGRLDDLRATRAVVRFVSFEPLNPDRLTWSRLIPDDRTLGNRWPVSGPSRPGLSLEDWVDEIYDLCEDLGAAFFFKQWGGRNKKAAGAKLPRVKLGDAMPEARI